MIKAFRLEDAGLQLTTTNMAEAARKDHPVWIALSSGSQCIAGLRMHTITKHIDLSALMEFHDMENIDDYELDKPWITDLIDEE